MAAKFVVGDDVYARIDKQMSEIRRMLNQEGGSPLHPDGVVLALQDIVEGKFFDWNSHLVHGIYNMPAKIITSFRARCAMFGIDVGALSWVGSEFPPAFDPDDPETVVVLDATLDTLQNTFEFAWAWATAGQEASSRYEGVISDPESLVLADGLTFTPWTLAWRRIKLDVNIGEIPEEIQSPMGNPGCALLFAAAEHPDWIRTIDGQKHFGFWLPGLKNALPGDVRRGRHPAYVPYVFYDPTKRRICMDCFRKEHRHEDIAVPTFL